VVVTEICAQEIDRDIERTWKREEKEMNKE
jgi:hypothetical protein